MDEQILEKLKEFVVKHTFVNDVILTRATRIQEELGLTGDDAFEFITAYAKEFNVDIGKFSFQKYFNSESDLFHLKTFSNNPSPKKAITLGDLEKAIIMGKWIEDVTPQEIASFEKNRRKEIIFFIVLLLIILFGILFNLKK